MYLQAYISTLIGKLECPDGKSWCLPVKINDGTASMDVDLSNKVNRQSFIGRWKYQMKTTIEIIVGFNYSSTSPLL